MNTIGLTLPIRNGTTGYFQQSYSSFEQVKSNLYNLLNTKRGERRFQPEFGTSLDNYLFELDPTQLNDILQDVISNDIKRWMPELQINKIVISILDKNVNSNNDMYMVTINVNFTFNNTTDFIEVSLERTQ